MSNQNEPGIHKGNCLVSSNQGNELNAEEIFTYKAF
jgi:hypothetical protein